MTTKNTNSTKKPANAVLEAARSARGFLKKSIELSAADTMSIVVEPVLEALGWNTRDPIQVRRQDNTIKLTTPGSKSVTVYVYPLQQDVLKSATRQAKNIEGWVVLTNGLCWNIFNSKNPGAIFRSSDLTQAPVPKGETETLDLLRSSAIAKGDLDKEWAAETIDDNVATTLSSLLQGSKAIITAMKEALESAGSKFSREELEASLKRLNISITTPDDDTKISTDSKTEAAKTSAAAAPKKIAPAKKPVAKKVAAKSGAKGPVAKSEPTDKEIDNNWPATATHCMKRRQNVAYIHMTTKTGKTTLLPGSVITAIDGKSLGKQMVEARKAAIDSGQLTLNEGLLQVVEPIEFSNPRLAATFAAGTLVKDISTWIGRDRKPLSQSLLAKLRAKDKASAKSKVTKKAASKTKKPSKSAVDESGEANTSEPEAKPRGKLKLNFDKTPDTGSSEGNTISGGVAEELPAPAQ